MAGFCPLEVCLLSLPVTAGRLAKDLEKKGERNANSGQRQRDKFKYKLNTLLSSKQKGNAKLEILRVTLKRGKCHSKSNWNNHEKEGLICHVDKK